MKLSNNLYFYPESGWLDCNTYVIKGDTNLIIDAGSPEIVPALVEEMRKDGIEPEDVDLICNTHLHLDHSGANQAFKDISGARIMLHPLQKEFFSLSVYDAAAFFGLTTDGFKEDACFTNNSLAEFGLDWEMVPSPGHSAESICFYSNTQKCLISGDVIFCGNIGRYDLPGGDLAKLGRSVASLAKFEVDSLLPGHMDIVWGADRVKANFQLVQRFFDG